MALELRLVGLWFEFRLGKAIAQQQLDAELLTLLPGYYQQRQSPGWNQRAWCQGDPARTKFAELVESMVRPGLELRCCDLGRRFAWLHWLLDRVAKSPDERELARMAVRGKDQFRSPGTERELPLHGTDYKWTGRIHVWLQPIAAAELTAHFNPQAMADEAIYKWSTELDAKWALQQILLDFSALQTFYAKTFEAHQGVLVVCD